MPTLIATYPALATLADTLHGLTRHEVPAGTTLFREHEACAGFPLLIEGEVRVSRSTSQGRALELYRVVPGELCLVSSSALFAQSALSAHGVTTRDTRLALLPPEAFRAALADPTFRDFVLGLFAERMADLTALIEAVAFRRLDQRLAAALLGHGSPIKTTHQALADELGTVREIVTRLLHRFEREGWLSLSRESISVRNANALRALADTQSGTA